MTSYVVFIVIVVLVFAVVVVAVVLVAVFVEPIPSLYAGLHVKIL